MKHANGWKMDDSVAVGGDYPSTRRDVCGSSDNDIGEPNVRDFEAIPDADDIASKLRPGSVVDGLDQAYILYCEYARLIGFSVKKGPQKYFPKRAVESDSIGSKKGDVSGKYFQCSWERHPYMARYVGKLPMFRKQHRRSGCTACLRVVCAHVESDWVVSILRKAHNHDLVAPTQGYLLRSARKMSDAQKTIVDAMKDSGIGVARAMKFMAREVGGPENIGFLACDAYAHISRRRSASILDNADSKALIDYFFEKCNTEQNFCWNNELDSERRLMNLFWSDTQSAIDYDAFGDVISLDTTFRTNRYNLIFTPFVGVNHHRQNIIFGAGLLCDETTESFRWLLSTFRRRMQCKEPQIVFSDQCQALMNTIDETFPSAKHRLCQWHVNENASSHFGRLNSDPSFRKLWHYCMNGCSSEDEFEECWRELIDSHDLIGNKWFSSMYSLRHRWASVFTRDRFSTGLHSTSRSESTNRAIKELCSRTTSLHELMTRFDELQCRWHRSESEEDAHCLGLPGLVVPNNHLLTQAAHILTRTIFRIFEKEATRSLNAVILWVKTDPTSEQVEFVVASTPDSTIRRIVRYNRVSHFGECSCGRWKTEGVICRHIFKILYLTTVHVLPHEYILRRWTRLAKHRNPRHVLSDSNCDVPERLPELVFANNAMRLMYEIVHNFKHVPAFKTVINHHLSKMYDALSLLNKQHGVRGGGGGGRKRELRQAEHGIGTSAIRDPPLPKHRCFPTKRTRSTAAEITKNNTTKQPKGNRRRGVQRSSPHLSRTSHDEKSSQQNHCQNSEDHPAESDAPLEDGHNGSSSCRSPHKLYYEPRMMGSCDLRCSPSGENSLRSRSFNASQPSVDDNNVIPLFDGLEMLFGHPPDPGSDPPAH